MCGILLQLSTSPEDIQLLTNLQESILQRGPDSFGAYFVQAKFRDDDSDKDSSSSAVLCASVLHIQGQEVIKQPYHLPSGDILAYNGEIFGGRASHAMSTKDGADDNLGDTPIFAQIISDAIHDYMSSLSSSSCSTQTPSLKSSPCSLSPFSTSSLLSCITNKLVNEIQGPYAFIYYCKSLQCFIYGRDPFGRRSLLSISRKREEIEEREISLNRANFVALTSVAPSSNLFQPDSYEIEELPVGGLYCVSIHPDVIYSNGSGNYRSVCFLPWPQNRIHLGKRTPDIVETHCDDPSGQFLSVLEGAIQRRVDKYMKNNDEVGEDGYKKCNIGVLFSGGIDSVLIAALLHKTLPLDEVIDLLNVTFDGAKNNDEMQHEKSEISLQLSSVNACEKKQIDIEEIIVYLQNKKREFLMKADTCSDVTEMNFFKKSPSMSPSSSSPKSNSIPYVTNDPSPDRLAAHAALIELHMLYPSRKWQLIHIDVSSIERSRYEERVKSVILPRNTYMDLNIGTAFWFASRGIGYIRSEEFVGSNQGDLSELYKVNDVRHGRPLLRHGSQGAAEGVGRDTRDTNGCKGGLKCSEANCKRKTKKGCIRSMCQRCCYKAKDRCKKAFSDGASDIICKVHKDQDDTRNITSVADKEESFSSLSSPSLPTSTSTSDNISSSVTPYQTPCKVLLVGLGADEQMAGYGRHRTAFQTGGEKALIDELNKDMARLWERNLGRDDRSISDHGKEGWFPFIDEEVVHLLNNLPIHLIAELGGKNGDGDKLILRNAARKLGLDQCTYLVKRAIQFGTRIAKHTNMTFHGSNRKGKGDAKILVEQIELAVDAELDVAAST